MKRLISNILLVAAVSFGLVSCNNAQKMIDAADQIDIKCNPEVLEVIAGNIDHLLGVVAGNEPERDCCYEQNVGNQSFHKNVFICEFIGSSA